MKLSKKLSLAGISLALIIFAFGCAWLLGLMNRDKPVTNYSGQSNSSKEAVKPSGDAEKNNDTAIVPDKPAESKPVIPDTELMHNDKSIPILMYHSIDFEKGNNARVPKENFKEQMKYLKDNGYTTLTMDQLYDFIANNKPVPKNSVVLTFDDGYVDNYTNAFPILKECDFKATVFMITSYVDNSPFLSLAQLREMQAYGIDIEPHTVNHDQLDKLNYEQQLQTLQQSKDFLDKNLGKNSKYIAYPYGKYNDITLKAAKEAGYTLAFRMDGGWANKKDGALTLKRVYIGGDYTLETFKNKITKLQTK